MSRVVYAWRGVESFLWPYDCVALIRDEGTGRLEITSAEGVVAHSVAHLSTLGDGPWTRVADGVLVHPTHAAQVDGVLHLPGDWKIPYAGTLPQPEKPERGPLVPGTALHRDDIMFVRNEIVHSNNKAFWVTDRGRKVPTGCTAFEAARLHGEIVMVGADYVNRRRIRSIRGDADGITVVLDTKRALHASLAGHQRLRQALGLPTSTRQLGLTPYLHALYALDLRDYPCELFVMPAETLKNLFEGNAFGLILNVLWQTVRLRPQGRALDYGNGMRGFWYRPVLPILARAGLVGAEAGQYSKDILYRYLRRACVELIETYRLFTYADLGFGDHRPDLRGIGAKHPSLVILCEKISLLPNVQQLAARFGCSWLVSHGTTKILHVEMFASHLKARRVGPLHVVAYVDYDPPGWIIAAAFVKQLARFDIKTDRLSHLITPDRFTADELKNFWHPLKSGGPEARILREWMRHTHGINGKARGMYSNHLVPYERVESAVAEITALRPLKT